LLASSSIPANVEIIEKAAFKGRADLQTCVIAENARLLNIGKESFSECAKLRLFYAPRNVEGIGEDCFSNCRALPKLRFASEEALKKAVGDAALDDAFENLGLGELSNVFQIEFDSGGMRSVI
jgi:hypothetical protein